MPSKYGKSARSSAFQWFLHRITGTFLVFLLITHFWVQHYDRTTASISHDVVSAEQAEQGVLPALLRRGRTPPSAPGSRPRASASPTSTA